MDSSETTVIYARHTQHCCEYRVAPGVENSSRPESHFVILEMGIQLLRHTQSWVYWDGNNVLLAVVDSLLQRFFVADASSSAICHQSCAVAHEHDSSAGVYSVKSRDLGGRVPIEYQANEPIMDVKNPLSKACS